MNIPFLAKYVDRKLAAKVEDYANAVQTGGTPRQPDRGQYTYSQLMQANAANLRERIGVYNPEYISYTTLDKMSKHHQMAFAHAFIRMPLESVDWWVDCEDKDVSAFLQQAIRPIWRKLVKSSCEAVKFGCAPHELVWEQKTDYQVRDKDKSVNNTMQTAFLIAKAKAIDPAYVTLMLQDDDFAGFKQMIGVGGDVAREKAYHFVHDEIFGNIYGRPRFIHSYDPWYWQSIVVGFTNRYLERSGSPISLATAPEGFTATGQDGAGNPIETNNLDLAQAVAEAVREGTAVSLPSAGKDEPQWGLEYLSDDNRGGAFDPVLNKYDTWMLRGMFIPERALTQDAAVGTNAMAGTHGDMFIMSEESLIADIADAVNEYIIPQLLLYNFGAGAPEAYVKVKGFTDERKQMIKEIFVTMIEAGFAQPAAEELARELDIPMSAGAAQADVQTPPAAPGTKPASDQPAVPAKADTPATKADVQAAAKTLTEVHSEVVHLLSDRKLSDACCRR